MDESVVTIPAKFASVGGTPGKLLEDNLTVSWIVVDPARKRAANVSSRRPVSVLLRRRWMMSSYAAAARDDVEVRYSTVVEGGGERGSAAEMVEVAVVVTCGVKGEGEVHVREVSVVLEDMDGRNLSGEESLVILGEAMESGKRRMKMGEEREGYYYEEYAEMRRERRERKERREWMVDMACMAVGFSIFFALWCFVLFR